MKRKLTVFILVMCIAVSVLSWMGIGPYSSGSATADLVKELEAIYGTEYTGKATEAGTEDMTFVIIPKTRFLTNWDLRHTFGMDYKYECKVIYTAYTDGNAYNIRTITYQAVDPMGEEKMPQTAHLLPDTMEEKTVQK